MEITLTTPSILFSAISLLLLAYTNRFLALAALIRELYRKKVSNEMHLAGGPDSVERQIVNLKVRIDLIRSMQFLGILGFILCTSSMFAIFMNQQGAGTVLFGGSLLAIVASLVQSIREIVISVDALKILLGEIK